MTQAKRLPAGGGIPAAKGHIERIAALERANRGLENLLESAGIAAVMLDPQLAIRTFTPAASALLDLQDSDVGRPFAAVSDGLGVPELASQLELVLATGEIIEHQLPRDAERRHFLLRLMPYRPDKAAIGGVIVSLIDVTTLAEIENHQQVLISELNHRVKNMLAVVISIAGNTLEAAPSHPAHGALMGRLRAMGRTYSALSFASWTQVAVGEIVRNEAEPYGRDRFRLEGPRLMLDAQQSLSLGMVIHELATNAAKYGALSVPRGLVSVRWEKQGANLTIHWQERNGPPVASAPTPGFGLSLLEGEITYRHGGKVETRFAPEGLSVVIALRDSG